MGRQSPAVQPPLDPGKSPQEPMSWSATAPPRQLLEGSSKAHGLVPHLIFCLVPRLLLTGHVTLGKALNLSPLAFLGNVEIASLLLGQVWLSARRAARESHPGTMVVSGRCGLAALAAPCPSSLSASVHGTSAHAHRRLCPGVLRVSGVQKACFGALLPFRKALFHIRSPRKSPFFLCRGV